MPNLPHRNEKRRSRAVPVAMTLFGLAAVFIGLGDPGGSTGSQPSALTPDQMQLIRADAVAGFPLSALPDNPPRGPGP